MKTQYSEYKTLFENLLTCRLQTTNLAKSIKKDHCFDLLFPLIAWASLKVVRCGMVSRCRHLDPALTQFTLLRDPFRTRANATLILRFPVTRRSLFSPPYALLAIFLIGRVSLAKSRIVSSRCPSVPDHTAKYHNSRASRWGEVRNLPMVRPPHHDISPLFGRDETAAGRERVGTA